MVDTATEPWGIKIEMVEMKDVEIPEGMQRAMAREAEAIREKRARIVKAEAELEASIKLTQGAKEMEGSPIALELRRMQMLSEIGIMEPGHPERSEGSRRLSRRDSSPRSE